MEYTERPAPVPLDRTIHCFWFLRGYFPPSEPQTVVADGRLEIILHLGNAFSRLDVTGTAHEQGAAMISGQLTAPVTVHGNGEGDVVGIRFRTASGAALLRHLPGDLTDRVESLDLLSRPLAVALHTAAIRYQTPDERVAALSAVLSRYAVDRIDEVAVEAVRQLDDVRGPRVREVSRRLGVSVRTLERRVVETTGLAPAVLRRVMRFRRAFRLLDATPRGGWTSVAAQSGYTDQAHLIRDFRQFAGAAPGDFFQADPALARAIMSGDDSPGAPDAVRA